MFFPLGGGSFQIDSACTSILANGPRVMDSWGLIAIILCCGLFGQNMTLTLKLKALQERVEKLEE